MAKPILTVKLPDDSVGKRQTDRQYTHAVVAISGCPPVWKVQSWHLSRAAAMKARHALAASHANSSPTSLWRDPTQSYYLDPGTLQVTEVNS